MAERDPRIIGARIAERRQVLDMTQEQMAAVLGVSRSTLANWERGVSFPRRKLGKVKQVLGADLDSDSYGQPSPAPQNAGEALDLVAEDLEDLLRRIRDGQGKGHNDDEENGGGRRAG